MALLEATIGRLTQPECISGSEKWHVKGSELGDKYTSELSSINKSLSALTHCVLALTQKTRAHVPYRDSVLTRLVQSSLQGSGRTSFIVTLSASKDCLEESFSTLRFAERLKALNCHPIRRRLMSSEMAGEQREYYENQIQRMRVRSFSVWGCCRCCFHSQLTPRGGADRSDTPTRVA